MTLTHFNDWLIIANGEPLALEKTKRLAENKAIIALDGALATAVNYGIKPQLVIGDLDSVALELIKSLQQDKDIKFIYDPDQNTTDLEKALNYLKSLKPNTVTICHATGWRLDHTLYNLRLLKRFHENFKSLILVTELEKIYYLKNQVINISANSKQPLALLAFPEVIIKSQGLEYDMDNLLLKFAYQESTSNALISPNARIEINGEALLLISHNTNIAII